MPRRPLPWIAALLLACGPGATGRPAKEAARPPVQAGLSAPGTDDAESVPLARQQGREQLFQWQPFSKETFDRARREGRFLLLHGAAEWCHWCHVMEATTYLDPEVGALLRDRFIAIRVDIDQRPDIAARYEDWGWPATVIFTPGAEELGKLRGFLPRERLLAILRELTGGGGGPRGAAATPGPGEQAAPEGALPWIGARVMQDLDGYYDEAQGGWGTKQKAPLGANVEVELLRGGHGDARARGRALLTLSLQRALLDPVWGGLYQYSTGGDWRHPHFEKLMTVQAAAIEAYSRAYRATREEALLRDARLVARYLDELLSSPEGAFLVSQDADVGAHDPRTPFIDGHVFYAKDDAGRRALGMPRIDDHVYARENGLAIAALCALYEATGDPAVLARARRAADVMLRTHVLPDGSVRREASPTQTVRYLVDAAALGRGLARLAEVSKGAVYQAAATRVAQAMLQQLLDKQTGRLWVGTQDPAAAGVFARRTQPFSHNVLAARFLAALGRVTGDAGHRRRALQLLAASATPRALADEGRMVGEFLLALDEAGALRW